MTFGELIHQNVSQIKEDVSLTYYFKEAYSILFGNYPACTSCSLTNEWQKFQKAVVTKKVQEEQINLTQKQLEQMQQIKETKRTFRLKDHELSIFSYINQEGDIVRKFVKKADDNFVIEYLTNGTEEEIEERKSQFLSLPEDYQNEESIKEESTKAIKTTKKK